MKRDYYQQEELWSRELSPQDKEKLKLLRWLMPPDVRTLLDAGCGTGTLTNELEPEKYDIYGVDISDTALRHFKHKAVVGDISDMPFFEDKRFDMVICSDVLEHVPPDRFEHAVSELKRVARKYILIFSPNDEDLEFSQTRCWQCGTTFHINWHFRSLNLDTLIELFSDSEHGRSFQPVIYSYFGDLWVGEPRIKYRLKRALGIGYRNWDLAVCPFCGAKQSERTGNNYRELETEDLERLIDTILNREVAGFSLGYSELMLFMIEQGEFDNYPRLEYLLKRPIILIPETEFKGETVRVYFLNRKIVLPGLNSYIKRFTVQYPIMPYILSDDKFSIWGASSSGGGRWFECHNGDNRTLVIFPFVEEILKGELVIDIGQIIGEPYLSVNVYDISERYVNIRKLRPRAKSQIRCKLPPYLIPPNEGLIIELILSSRTGYTAVEIKKLSLNRIGESGGKMEIVELRKDSCQEIELLGHKFLAFELEPRLGYNYEIVILPKVKWWLMTDLRRGLLKLTESELALLTEPLVTQGEIEKRLTEILIRESEALKLDSQLKVLRDIISEANVELEEGIRRLEDKCCKIDDKLETVSRNINLLVGALKKPHKVIIRKLSASFSKLIKASNRLIRKGLIDRLFPDKPYVVVLTPDVDIDRRIVQMCRVLLKSYANKCKIIAALEGQNDLGIRKLSVSRVKPGQKFRQGLGNIGKTFTDIDLTQFYWLHEEFLDSALAEDADLFIACDLPVLPAAVIASKSKGVPLIYDAHELYPEQVVFSDSEKELLTAVERTFIKYADLVITVNDSIADEMAKRYEIDRPAVILNAIDSPRDFNPFKSKPDLFRERFNLSRSDVILLYQGGIVRNRNLENLVKAMREVQDNVILIIMGRGELEEGLKMIAQKLNLLNRKVFFHEAVRQDVLLRYTASADIGIIPYPAVDLNSYYCTPNKLFEYIQAGLPILANDLPELRRFVEGYKIGLVHKMETVEDIAEAINTILRANLNEFRENLKRVRRELSWSEQARKLVNLVSKLPVLKTKRK